MSIKIFLVDDHNVLRQGISQVINSQEDMEVVGQAGSPNEVLSMIQSVEPEIILMDINLPGISGIDLSKSIKEHFPEIKIIILSMYNQEKYVFQVIESGLEGYILKEAQMDELLSAIRTVASGHSYIYPTLTDKVFAKLRGDKAQSKRFTHKALENMAERDLEILRYLASGLGNQEIAVNLSIKEKTVRNRLSNIFKELGVGNRTEAALFAVEHGILDHES